MINQSAFGRTRVITFSAALLALLALLFAVQTFPPPKLLEANSPPDAVGSITLTRSGSTLTVSWNAVDGAAKYHALYQADGAGDWLPPIPDYQNITATSFSFDIDSSKSYVVGVRAGNANGWGPWTDSPVSNPPLPAAVGSITLTRNGSTLTVSWNAVAGAAKYHALYQADGAGDWLPPIPDYQNITATSFSFDIDSDKSYVVGVRAGNSAGWGPWTDSPTSNPPLPAAVGSITLTRSDGTLTVSWNAVDGAANYHALYQADGAGDWLPPIPDYNNITATGFTFNVDNTKSYVVGVRAGNSAGWGPWTDSPASGPYTPPTPTPTPAPTPDPNAGIIVQDSSGNAITALAVPEGGEASYQVMLATKPAADTKVCIGLSVRDNDDGDITFKGQASDVVALDLTFTPDNWNVPQTVTLVAAEDNDYVNGARDVDHDAREYYSGKVDLAVTEIDNDEITVTATRGSDGDTASVSWTAYEGENFEYYRVIVCDDAQYNGASCSGAVWTGAPVWDANSTGPVSVPDLDPGTGYGVILQTWRNGSAMKSHATLPAGPAAPDNLAVNPGNGYLDLSWNAVTGATAYDIRARAAGVNDWHSVANKVTATTHRYTTDQTIDQVAVRTANAHSVGNWTELSRLPAFGWLNVVQSSGGASSQSGSIAAKLAAPATITVTRDNARDEKLHVSWAAVTGASGYNLACSQTDGWSWWQCGSTTSASTTSLTVDNGPRGGLHSTRKYMVAVRAVTSNEADASDWKRSENVYPAFAQLRNLTHRRSGGSMTLYWTPNFYTTGYEIDCAVSGSAYTRCATLTNQKDTDTQHSVTISTWTVGDTTYNIDDGATYDVKITSTNQWGKSATGMRPPLIGPLPNVSNLGETSDGYGEEVSNDRSAATGFSTGSNSGGYTIQGVTIGFLGLASNRIPSSPLSVAIHAASGGNPAATATHTLTNVHGSTTTAGNATYACSGTCRLSANTTYFLVLSANSTYGYKWDTTGGDDESNTSNFGWTIDNRLKRQSGNSWTDHNWTTMFRVSATLGPRSLTASNVAETTATLTIDNHAGDWYYKHTNTGATCDGPVSGTSKNLTGLTANTSYTYSAYSDSSCSTLLATAAAFTTAASVGNLGEATDGQGQDVTQLARAATGFSTGTNSGGYLLQSVTLAFRTPSSGTPDRALNVAIHAESAQNSDIPAATATYTLNKASGDPKLAGNVTYDCSGTCPLAANTKYFLEPSTEGVIPYKWESTFSDDETNTGNLGWTIDDGLKYDDPTQGTWITRTWSGKFRMSALLVE